MFLIVILYNLKDRVGINFPFPLAQTLKIFTDDS